MLAVNYETWRWDNFRLEELGEHAVVLALVEGCYWDRYTKSEDGFWYQNEPDGTYLDSYELKTFIFDEVGPEEYVIVAPNGLMSMKENSDDK